jgi:oxygen-independent coproporphyrinogen-3 oxidase
MELPYNTVFSKELRVLGQDEPPSAPIADWPTKRAWVDYAYDAFLAAGYEVSSAYTLVKNKGRCKFVYRDGLWHGADGGSSWPNTRNSFEKTVLYGSSIW